MKQIDQFQEPRDILPSGAVCIAADYLLVLEQHRRRNGDDQSPRKEGLFERLQR